MSDTENTREQPEEEEDEYGPHQKGGEFVAFLPLGMVFIVLGLQGPNYSYLAIGIVFFALSFYGVPILGRRSQSKGKEAKGNAGGPTSEESPPSSGTGDPDTN